MAASKPQKHGDIHEVFTNRQAALKNADAKVHPFLADMFGDSYFPRKLVAKGALILVDLCAQFEAKKPSSAEDVYALTHAATEAFNELQEAFFEADSEIETAARDAIAMDFEFILRTYGHGSLDLEAAIAPRDW